MIGQQHKSPSIQVLIERLYSPHHHKRFFVDLCIVPSDFESEREAKALVLSDPSSMTWERTDPMPYGDASVVRCTFWDGSK